MNLHIPTQLDLFVTLSYLFHYFSAAQLLSYPGKNKIPLNYHIVEVYRFFTNHLLRNDKDGLNEIEMFISGVFNLQVIFGELFQLPCPPHIDVMYTTLLIELCKLQPGSLPQVVSLVVCVTSCQDALKCLSSSHILCSCCDSVRCPSCGSKSP